MKLMNLKTFILLFVYCFADALQCPPRENITPCMCLEQNNNLHMHCSIILSVTQLQSAVQGMRGYKFTTFNIDKSNFEYIPSTIFEDISIEKLTISKSNFSRIANLLEPQFKGLENSLKTLVFIETFSEKEPLPYLALEHLSKLQTLEFRKSYVGTVHNLWFKEGPSSLRDVRFVESHLQNVGYTAFQSLKNLRIIDLSDNQIDYVARASFPDPASHLEEINLQRNALTCLEEDTFKDMPKLSRVNLELNEISTLDEKVWSSVWSHLQYLQIDCKFVFFYFSFNSYVIHIFL
nr:P-granule-associated novel protein 1-like [Parasteatoda tepidariorum]